MQDEGRAGGRERGRMKESQRGREGVLSKCAIERDKEGEQERAGESRREQEKGRGREK